MTTHKNMTRAKSSAMEPQLRENSPPLIRSSTYIFAILSFIFALLSESPTFVEANGNNDAQQQGTTLLPRPIPSGGRPQLMVAIYCGGLSAAEGNSRSASTLYHNQYLEVDSRKWRSDRDATATCTSDKQAILNYCKKVYPDHDIRNIVESSRPYKIDNWCRLGSSKRKCRTRLTTRPYRCLEGTFQSDALLVPERCVFDHVHNKSVCESSDSWNRSATEACHSKSMKLQSFGMLQPCGLDVFSGVEFVCCPKGEGETRSKSDNGQTEGSNSFAQAANNILKEAKDEQSNSIKSDDIPKKHHDRSDNQSTEQSESDSDDENDDDDDEYDEEEDGYDDDSSSWNGDKSPSASTTTTTTTTSTTTTTTELPIQHYLSHFDLAHEHDEYRKAELSIQSSYDDKVAHVMRDWNQFNRHIEEMKKKDPVAAEEFRKKMTHQFKKTLDGVQQEIASEKHQLTSMHAERAMAIINRRKKAAMDCLTQALDRIPIRTRQIERCIVRLLKALEKDRAHTLRQYKNLLNLNTGEALREKKTILDHLITLNRAANQSIAMLDRSPILVNKLKGTMVALWHKLRNIPLDEPIVKESEEKIMDQLEEEAAQRKIERERERLNQLEINQERQENPVKVSNDVTDPSSKVDDQHLQETNRGSGVNPTSVAQDVSQNTQPTKSVEVSEPSTVSPNLQTANENQSTIPTAAKLVRQTELSDKDRTHYQANSVGFAHLRLESPYHELSYSVKHEPLEGNLKFGSSTILVSSFAAVILLAFFGVKYYGKHSTRAYRRQGFSEVGRSCAEEKTMAQMQFNGYENPAYKFFEAEA